MHVLRKQLNILKRNSTVIKPVLECELIFNLFSKTHKKREVGENSIEKNQDNLIYFILSLLFGPVSPFLC